MADHVLDPGQMSARLDLEVAGDTPDGQGGVTTLFSAITALWARIEPVAMSGTERADEVAAFVTHRIWIRFRDDVRVGMRFRKGPRSFAIGALSDPDETRRYLVCRCTEVLA